MRHGYANLRFGCQGRNVYTGFAAGSRQIANKRSVARSSPTPYGQKRVSETSTGAPHGLRPEAGVVSDQAFA